MARSVRLRRLAQCWPVGLAPAASGCQGPQSALEPAGKDAASIADLFVWMIIGGILVWLGTIGMAVYAKTSGSRAHQREKVRFFIVGGGAVIPVVVLGVLLVYGLRLMPELLDHGPEDGLRIRIRGEQWWWRVLYEMPDGSKFELANELRLPLGERTPLWLESRDVIHSFWIPSLGGKIDLIPGRVTRASLEPTRTGVFRGACAEYCGSSHAKMGLFAIALERSAFDAWARAERGPARPPSKGASERGAELFVELGCGACHTIRGTRAAGVIGPDLTHVGGRHSLGAATLGSEAEDFVSWLAHTDSLKPGVHMPSFEMLAREELDDLASYLHGLR